jgi:ELWxxDGT repeat protein
MNFRACTFALLLVAGGLTTGALSAPSAQAFDDDVALVADIEPGPGGASPRQLVNVGGALSFVATDTRHGSELWWSDGTSAGTRLVTDLGPGAESRSIGDLTAAGDAVYFSAALDDLPGRDLYTSNGTPAGTIRLVDLSTEGDRMDTAYSPGNLTAVGDTLYFTVCNFDDCSMWTSDGTPSGTVEVAPIGIPAGPANGDPLTPFVVRDGAVYFAAYDDEHGEELWTSNGTAEGTGVVVDLDPRVDSGQGISSRPSHLEVVGDTLYFEARGYLYRSDGTASGTHTVAPDAGHFYPEPLASVGSTLYFSASDTFAPSRRRLWRTDGTAAGTSLVADIDVITDRDSSSTGRGTAGVTVDGSIWFAAEDEEHGVELWTSNGTGDGTRMVADLNPLKRMVYPVGSYPEQLTGLGGLLFFTADDGANGRELWRSDGTPAGTGVVADLASSDSYGDRLAGPGDLNILDNGLYFRADDGVHGSELFRTTPGATPLPTPVALTQPEISGIPTPGQELHASTGTWSDDDLGFTYRWWSGEYPRARRDRVDLHRRRIRRRRAHDPGRGRGVEIRLRLAGSLVTRERPRLHHRWASAACQHRAA